MLNLLLRSQKGKKNYSKLNMSDTFVFTNQLCKNSSKRYRNQLKNYIENVIIYQSQIFLRGIPDITSFVVCKKNLCFDHNTNFLIIYNKLIINDVKVNS